MGRKNYTGIVALNGTDIPDNLASQFSTATSYTSGNLVIYEGKLYRCTASHSGAWNSSHFTAIGLSDLSSGGGGSGSGGDSAGQTIYEFTLKTSTDGNEISTDNYNEMYVELSENKFNEFLEEINTLSPGNTINNVEDFTDFIENSSLSSSYAVLCLLVKHSLNENRNPWAMFKVNPAHYCYALGVADIDISNQVLPQVWSWKWRPAGSVEDNQIAYWFSDQINAINSYFYIGGAWSDGGVSGDEYHTFTYSTRQEISGGGSGSGETATKTIYEYTVGQHIDYTITDSGFDYSIDVSPEYKVFIDGDEAEIVKNINYVILYINDSLSDVPSFTDFTPITSFSEFPAKATEIQTYLRTLYTNSILDNSSYATMMMFVCEAPLAYIDETLLPDANDPDVLMQIMVKSFDNLYNNKYKIKSGAKIGGFDSNSYHRTFADGSLEYVATIFGPRIDFDKNAGNTFGDVFQSDALPTAFTPATERPFGIVCRGDAPALTFSYNETTETISGGGSGAITETGGIDVVVMQTTGPLTLSINFLFKQDDLERQDIVDTINDSINNLNQSFTLEIPNYATKEDLVTINEYLVNLPSSADAVKIIVYASLGTLFNYLSISSEIKQIMIDNGTPTITYLNGYKLTTIANSSEGYGIGVVDVLNNDFIIAMDFSNGNPASGYQDLDISVDTIPAYSSGSSSSTPSGMENPMTTQGDLIVGGTDGAPERLAKGTTGQVLEIDSNGDVSWGNAKQDKLTTSSVSNGTITNLIGFNSSGNVVKTQYQQSITKTVITDASPYGSNLTTGDFYVFDFTNIYNFFGRYCTIMLYDYFENSGTMDVFQSITFPTQFFKPIYLNAGGTDMTGGTQVYWDSSAVKELLGQEIYIGCNVSSNPTTNTEGSYLILYIKKDIPLPSLRINVLLW